MLYFKFILPRRKEKYTINKYREKAGRERQGQRKKFFKKNLRKVHKVS